MAGETTGTAFVTGATSGIGAAFAKELAGRGYNLIVTGRRKEKIENFAEVLREENSREVEVIIAELSNREALDAIASKISTVSDLEFLVNNAGFTKIAKFHEIADDEHEKMLNVHSLAVMKLMHAALPNMVKRGGGAIINVSSLSAFTPLHYNAMYAATKSFINLLTESIHLELKGTGVKVQALCPGMTRTDFHQRIGLDPVMFYKSRGPMKAMSPEEVVSTSLRALKKGKVVCVPGYNNKLTAFLTTVLPRAIIYKAIVSMLSRR